MKGPNQGIEWQCSRCTLIQPQANNMCMLCGHRQQITIDNKQNSNGWECLQCTFIQSSNTERCEMCQTQRYEQKEEALSAENNHEDIVRQLTSMGFDEEQCMMAYSFFSEANQSIDIGNMVQYLLNTNFERNSKSKHHVANCLSLQRIGDILKYYHEWISVPKFAEAKSDESHHDEIYKYINNDNVSNVSLLNDFHHIIFEHDNEFEEIYNYFISDKVLKQICSKASCKLLSRNTRDRLKCSNDDKFIRALYYNGSSKEIAVHQLVDKIHCYYLHSFDLGYRLNRKETKTIEELKTDHFDFGTDNIDHKILKLQSIVQSKTNTVLNKTKFITNNDRMFSVGATFVYPDLKCRFTEPTDEQKQYTQDLTYTNLLHIDYKYGSLKEELINNEICTISLFQWNNRVETAAYHLNSDYCKVHEPTEEQKKEYKMSTIKIQHLIAILVYCGFDTLSTRFSETYRKLHVNEDDESLIQRHSNFARLGSYLWELCDFFAHPINERAPYFHGISEVLYFDHTTCMMFNSPFSTSSDFAVAVNFCSDEGLILTLQDFPIDDDPAEATSCSWISPFCNEQETLFLSMGSRLWITNIIRAPNGENYEEYLIALNYIQVIMTTQPAETSKTLSNVTTQMVFRLLSHELHRYEPDKYFLLKSIPPYIESLLHYYCINKRVIEIYWKLFNKGIKPIEHIFYSKQFSFIDLKILATLFPNAKSIQISNIYRPLKLHPSMVDAVVEFVKLRKDSCTLTQIEFKCDKTEQWIASKMVEKHQKALEDIQWVILAYKDMRTVCAGTSHSFQHEDVRLIIANDGNIRMYY